MNHREKVLRLAIAYATVSIATCSVASVTTTTSYDSWAASAGSVTTLDFVFSQAQILNTQYADLGVIFPDAEEVAYSGNFPLDGWGCKGSVLGDDDIVLLFDVPRTSIGTWYKGNVNIELYLGNELVFMADGFGAGGPGIAFAGLFGSRGFDKVVLKDPANFIFVDNIVFGAAVPGPAAWMALLLGVSRSRRRLS